MSSTYEWVIAQCSWYLVEYILLPEDGSITDNLQNNNRAPLISDKTATPAIDGQPTPLERWNYGDGLAYLDILLAAALRKVMVGVINFGVWCK